MPIEFFEEVYDVKALSLFGGRRKSGQPLPAYIYLLLISQLLFNIGFYIVVPFLAVVLADGFAQAGTMIGLVLGLRTFSQQGLFFLGGGLTDKYGARPILLTGISLRVIGFITTGVTNHYATVNGKSDNLANTWSLVGFIGGVVIIGFAAALFSPAVETSLADSGARLEAQGTSTRAHIFALDSAYSTVGSGLGPLIGALLLPLGFDICCYAAAAIFFFLGITHLIMLPTSVHPARRGPITQDWSHVLRDRRFLVLAAAYSMSLVAYNQMYLSLPVELTRGTGSDQSMGIMFLIAGVWVIILQVPLARIAARYSPTRAVAAGFLIMASSFTIVAVCAPWSRSLAPAIAFVVVLNVGNMIVSPIARDLVGVHAKNIKLGTYYGVLNSVGGAAVLITSPLLGKLLNSAYHPTQSAMIPWIVLAAGMVGAAITIYVWGRRTARLLQQPRHADAPDNSSQLTDQIEEFSS